MITEDVLKAEVERVPIRVQDFDKENSVTRKYMFHNLIFSWKPYFRFTTENLRLLGFVHCSHRGDSQARDSLWGMMNPLIEDTVDKEHIK